MARKLPPLYPLRTFEAAARHLNFTRAAEELSLSQAAVSQQVKSLEEFLGTALFIRRGRRLKLTQAGEGLLPAVGRAFDDIVEALEALQGTQSRRQVSVALAPHFAAAWLTPRLGGFLQRHPDIELRLIQRIEDINFAREEVDLAVRFGADRQWSEHVTEPLLTAPLTPVCSPNLVTSENSIALFEDLSRFVLLDVPRLNLWAQWAKASDVNLGLHNGIIIDDYNVLLRAAVDGQGVALGIKGLIDEYLEAGHLIQLFDNYQKTDLSYFLVYPRGPMFRPDVKAFYDWIFEETAVLPAK